MNNDEWLRQIMPDSFSKFEFVWQIEHWILCLTKEQLDKYNLSAYMDGYGVWHVIDKSDTLDIRDREGSIIILKCDKYPELVGCNIAAAPTSNDVREKLLSLFNNLIQSIGEFTLQEI